MTERDYASVEALPGGRGIPARCEGVPRVASMRSLYHWNADANQEY
jgi:hypothetical protein